MSENLGLSSFPLMRLRQRRTDRYNRPMHPGFDGIKRLFAIGLLTLLALQTASAQQGATDKQTLVKTPDLSGNWTLDKARSQAGSNTKTQLADVSLTILQNGPEIRIKKRIDRNGVRSEEEAVYFTNRPVEPNPEAAGKTQQTTTRWSGNKLITIVSTTVDMSALNGRSSKMEMKEVWELSKDGKTLTQTISAVGLPNSTESNRLKFVFTRKS
jgi:hypothetical protein